MTVSSPSDMLSLVITTCVQPRHYTGANCCYILLVPPKCYPTTLQAVSPCSKVRLRSFLVQHHSLVCSYEVGNVAPQGTHCQRVVPRANLNFKRGAESNRIPFGMGKLSYECVGGSVSYFLLCRLPSLKLQQDSADTSNSMHRFQTVSSTS